MNNQNKLHWEKEFDDNLAKFNAGIIKPSKTQIVFDESVIRTIKSFISSLLSKVIDEIELEKKEPTCMFFNGYNEAVLELDKIKKLKKKKYGIE